MGLPWIVVAASLAAATPPPKVATGRVAHAVAQPFYQAVFAAARDPKLVYIHLPWKTAHELGFPDLAGLPGQSGIPVLHRLLSTFLSERLPALVASIDPAAAARLAKLPRLSPGAERALAAAEAELTVAMAAIGAPVLDAPDRPPETPRVALYRTLVASRDSVRALRLPPPEPGQPGAYPPPWLRAAEALGRALVAGLAVPDDARDYAVAIDAMVRAIGR